MTGPMIIDKAGDQAAAGPVRGHNILLLLCSAVHRLVIRQMALMWQMICNCRTSTPDKVAAAETIFNMQLPFISTLRYLN